MSDGHRSRDRKATMLRDVLTREGENVASSLKHYNQLRYESTEGLGDAYPALKAEARAIKEDSIERIPELVDRAREAVEARGGQFHYAESGSEARTAVREILEARDADSVVKSKSMTCEEIDLRSALADAGYSVTETDLGELVLQVADDSPSHLVGPSVHLSVSEIADRFETAFDLDDGPDSPAELTEVARDHVGAAIRDADVGVTGANFVVADSGSIVLVTNEGNARQVVESTNTLVTVAGVEKLIPSLEDLSPFVQLIGRSAGEPSLTAYTSIYTPPIDTAPYPFSGDEMAEQADDSASEREFHLIVLDNGRMDMRADETLREALYCIRCGACADSCANFQHLGGHAFGGETYTGGIAPSWEAGIHGPESAASFNDLCTSCSRCVDQCPVQIDIPWLNTVLRDRLSALDGADAFSTFFDRLLPDEETPDVPFRNRLFGNFEQLAKVGSRTAPVSNALAQSGLTKTAMERVLGVDRRRTLPTFSSTTFTKWARSHQPTTPGGQGTARAVLYPDLYTQYVLVNRGKAALRALEGLGVDVRIPSVGSSGRPALSQGMIDTAAERAHAVYADLEPHIEAGRDVVVIEPSDAAMFRRDYEHLLPQSTFGTLATNTYEVMEYLQGVRTSGDGGDSPVLAPAEGGDRVIYHANCQQRTAGLVEPTVDLFESLGYEVLGTDVECCGMAGSFGYKQEYYEVSMAVGSDLETAIRSVDGDPPVLTSGMSCATQIGDLLDRKPVHPLEFLVD